MVTSMESVDGVWVEFDLGTRELVIGWDDGGQVE